MGVLWPGGPLTLPSVFLLDELDYTLPVIPTRELLYMLGADAWWELIPNRLVEPGRTELLERLYDEQDPLEYEHLWVAGTQLLGRLGGLGGPTGAARDGYFPAHRVAATIVARWPLFTGWAVAHGFDPLAEPLYRVIAAGYQMMREGCGKEADRAQLEASIWAPPPHAPENVPLIPLAVEAAQARAVLDEVLPGESPADLALTGLPGS